MSRATDTIAALATPVGTAALAVIRVSGPDTPRLAQELCGTLVAPRQARHGDYRDRQGVTLDDVVFLRFAAPRSYTAEDALEISCHGNPFIAQKILEDLFARGCRPARAGEFTERAFLNGRIDLSQAEAVMDVIHARSERALAAAQQQLRGALGRRVQGAVDELLQILAHIEAYIDFPDEDLPPEDQADVCRRLGALATDLGRLLATSHYGEVLRSGFRTVIVGRPNVGKSSLLNRLVGRDRALVSPEPGTTRDFIEETVIIGPHLLRLIDTAGLNQAPAPLERLGIEKTRERLEEADLFLVVVDHESVSENPVDLHAGLTADNTLLVRNKSDLPSRGRLPDGWSGFRTVDVSALTGAGLETLQAALSARIDDIAGQIGEEQVAVSARHAASLGEARSAVDAALRALREQLPPELAASELRLAVNALGDIRGRIDNEEMLDKLFASFCIGK